MLLLLLLLLLFLFLLLSFMSLLTPTANATALKRTLSSAPAVVGFSICLFLSGLQTRAGYETNNEEKRKKKFKFASIKEPPSHLRLLYFGSSVPLDNHLSQALSNGIDPAPTRTLSWLEFLHFVQSSCIVCKFVSSRRRLELFVFSSQYTLGLD